MELKLHFKIYCESLKSFKYILSDFLIKALDQKIYKKNYKIILEGLSNSR